MRLRRLDLTTAAWFIVRPSTVGLEGQNLVVIPMPSIPTKPVFPVALPVGRYLHSFNGLGCGYSLSF